MKFVAVAVPVLVLIAADVSIFLKMRVHVLLIFLIKSFILIMKSITDTIKTNFTTNLVYQKALQT